MSDREVNIKWAGPNTPYIKFSDDERIFLTKRELVALQHEIDSFINYYQENFTVDRIDITDEVSSEYLQEDQVEQDQKYRMNRYNAIDRLAKQAGFTDAELRETEFCLAQFFDLIVEECARAAELQARNYSDGEAASGCAGAAAAVRAFGSNIGNERVEYKAVIGPTKKL